MPFDLERVFEDMESDAPENPSPERDDEAVWKAGTCMAVQNKD